MTEAMNEAQKACVQKLCLDAECTEAWEKLGPEGAAMAREFVYCPFCSEELQLQCSACREALTSRDFKFCPWCGARFDEE